MSPSRTFTAKVDVELSEWDDDEIQEEAERRGMKFGGGFEGIDHEDLARWAEMLRTGRDEEVLAEFRAALCGFLGLAFV